MADENGSMPLKGAIADRGERNCDRFAGADIYVACVFFRIRFRGPHRMPCEPVGAADMSTGAMRF